MLVYNTTYHVEEKDVRNFLIFMQESYIPRVLEEGSLSDPKILKILSHIEEGSACFSVQFSVESSAMLHSWHRKQGAQLNAELLKTFEDKIVGFPTLMEVVE